LTFEYFYKGPGTDLNIQLFPFGISNFRS